MGGPSCQGAMRTGLLARFGVRQGRDRSAGRMRVSCRAECVFEPPVSTRRGGVRLLRDLLLELAACPRRADRLGGPEDTLAAFPNRCPPLNQQRPIGSRSPDASANLRPGVRSLN